MPSGAVHPNKSYGVRGDASVGRPRSSARNGSPNAEPSRKTPPLHAAVYNTFNVQRHLTSAQTHRTLRTAAMDTWRTAVAVACQFLRRRRFALAAQQRDTPSSTHPPSFG